MRHSLRLCFRTATSLSEGGKAATPLNHINYNLLLQCGNYNPFIHKKSMAGDTVNRKEDYIGVFDSGVGGVSVLRQLKKLMPREKFYYFGDSANAPYGSRSTEEIRQLTLSAVEKMGQTPLKALVVACNTATAAAIEVLREQYPQLIVVGIEPALKPAADQFPGGRIGVMATEATLREEKFSRLLSRYAQTHTVCKIPATGLVELIEEGKADSREAEELLRTLLAPYAGQLDALVLGCTHYPFASAAIRRCLGPRVVLLDGGEGTARETMRRLGEADLLRDGVGEVLWHNSAKEEKLLELSQKLLNQP